MFGQVHGDGLSGTGKIAVMQFGTLEATRS